LLKINVWDLTPEQRAKKMAFEKELESYNKAITDVNNKGWKEAIDKQEKHYRNRKELYDKDYISSATYLKNLDELYNNMIDTFAGDNEELKILLEEIRTNGITINELMGKDTGEGLEELFAKIPGLKEHINTLIEMAKTFKAEMIKVTVDENETTLNNLTSKANKALAGFGKGVSFNEVYKGFDAVIAELNKQNATLDSKKDKEQYDNNLETIAKYTEAKNVLLTQDLRKMAFWRNQIISLVESISDGFGQALAKGFGAEGFKSLVDTIKQGFKLVLTVIVDSLDKIFVAATLSDLIMSLIPGVAVQEIVDAPN